MASSASSRITARHTRGGRPIPVTSSLPFRTRRFGYNTFDGDGGTDSDSGADTEIAGGSLPVLAVRAEGGRLVPEDPNRVADVIERNPQTRGSQTAIGTQDSTAGSVVPSDSEDAQQRPVIVTSEDGPVEARHISNNYLFGMKKWKGRVIERPLDTRSEVVKDLYRNPERLRTTNASTLKIGNIVYFLMFGWWAALVYFLIAGLMALTVVGWPMAVRCGQLALYMAWPFGKFVHTTSTATGDMAASPVTYSPANVRYTRSTGGSSDESDSASAALVNATPTPGHLTSSWVEVNQSRGGLPTTIENSETAQSTSPLASAQHSSTGQFTRYHPSFVIWLVLGAPIALPLHIIIAFLSWMLVVFIPVAKMNVTLMKRVLFEPPRSVCINDSSLAPQFFSRQSEVRLCVYEAVNIYYYKYTVDGMNVVLVNLLPFVVLSLLNGYLDKENTYTSNSTKFATSLIAIIPLAYYIGLAITSIAAQSTYAVGAVLNATFGSIVELTLYVSMLLRAHGKSNNSSCYEAIVKAALTGTLLATMLFIPGLCMIVGGLKHREQRFNWRSAGVSSSLLFVSVAGSYAPTLFAKAYGGEYETMTCSNCTTSVTAGTNKSSTGFNCSECSMDQSTGFIVIGPQVRNLSYVCAALLPLAYLLGLLFTLKTHRYIYDEPSHDDDDKFAVKKGSAGHGHSHGHGAQWSRLKGLVILLVATVLMSLLADQVTEHINAVLNNSGISADFIGVTLLAIVPDIPEIVNGVQFAMQNNISLSIEVGSSIAVQVCLLQIPILVWVDAIYGIGFHLVFNDTQLWTVIFGVLVMNYIFMDGKSDYFQGVILVIVYIILVTIYYFIPTSALHTTC
eukprot:scpid30741/ scgid26858/ Low affinity vacuolar monovalent cation/H(+) antiporter; Vacuolar Na(+)/H(+) exchanger